MSRRSVRLLISLIVVAPLALVMLDGRGSVGPESTTAAQKSKWSRAKLRRHRGRGGFRSGDRLFAPDSVWNKPVQQRGDLDPRSHSLSGALANFIETRINTPRLLNGGYPNIGADAYSTPIYRVSRRTKRVPVELEGDGSPSLRRILSQGVPIPPGAQPARGTDGHMTIYQPSTDTLWEFWRARRTSNGWEASWAGAMRNVSRNPGYYDSKAWGGRPLKYPEGWNWGSTATSLPVAGGTVTLAELRRGRINHALAIALPNVCRDVFSWPAQRSDGSYGSADCIPQGAHLRIDPSVNVDGLPLHPVAKLLAQAAQRYGMIVRDGTRVSAQFFLESPDPGRPSPYTGPGGLYRGADPWEILQGFPWRSLQVLPMRLCTRAPCYAR
jgi:hypothetical protein